jgi:hypothetical protein
MKFVSCFETIPLCLESLEIIHNVYFEEIFDYFVSRNIIKKDQVSQDEMDGACSARGKMKMYSEFWSGN